MEKYKNRYRISSARMENWNYGAPGMYFITICTKNRNHYFGRITNGKMIYNELGAFVNSTWLKTPDIRSNMQLELGEFITMPDHFHGIVIIGGGDGRGDDHDGGRGDGRGRYAMHRVSTEIIPTTEIVLGTEITTTNKFGPQSNNLASIIRGFKSSVTTMARKNNFEFGWQSRYHDHIIRSHDEFIRISNYIQNNPSKWNQ